MARTRIAILGAGPAGLGASWQICLQNKADFKILDRSEIASENAGGAARLFLRIAYLFETIE